MIYYYKCCECEEKCWWIVESDTGEPVNKSECPSNDIRVDWQEDYSPKFIRSDDIDAIEIEREERGIKYDGYEGSF